MAATFEPASPTMNAEAEHVRRVVAHVDANQPLNAEARLEALETLEKFECWAPFFRLIKRSIDQPAQRRLADYVRLARVQNLHLEDKFAAAETCAMMVQHLKLSYAQFREEALAKIIDGEDFPAEATILSAISDRLSANPDLVDCLERLCLLYEKKTHNDGLLGKTYERLLAADPHDLKALRYFKLAYTQNNDWEEVVEILKTMMKAVRRPQELFRVAQELAAIYLYQMDRAEDAIKVLKTYCADSPLDTSTILFEAHQRLADWHGCLIVLRQCLLSVEDDFSRAVLHLKIASLHEQLNELDPALENFAKASNLWPDLLDAIEGVVNVATVKKDWQTIQHWLGVLTAKVTDDRLGAQLRQAQKRLQDGLDHAKPN